MAAEQMGLRDHTGDEIRPQRHPSRGMFILPSLFTAGNIALGYYAMTQSVQGSAAEPVYFDHAALAIGAAALLDGVDGYIARRYNQKSELGAILDPLADKLLLLSAIVTLSFNHGPYIGQIPLWLTGTIIGRDLLLLIGIAVVRFIVGKVIVRPRIMGKIATVLQMIVVLWILLDWDRDLNARWLKVWTFGAAICTGVSGLLYIWDGVKQLGSHPASLPTVKNGAVE